MVMGRTRRRLTRWSGKEVKLLAHGMEFKGQLGRSAESRQARYKFVSKKARERHTHLFA
jgi:hypothetical protein